MAKTVTTFGPTIPGLRDFRNELRAIEKTLPKELQQANKEFAGRLVPSVQAAYDRHYPKAGSRSRRRKGRAPGRTRSTVRALATQTSAGIAIGGARVPHMLGQEFGSDKFPQFAPWTGPGPSGRGSAGRFLYPTIREEAPKLVEEYGEVLNRVASKAFDRGSAALVGRR